MLTFWIILENALKASTDGSHSGGYPDERLSAGEERLQSFSFVIIGLDTKGNGLRNGNGWGPWYRLNACTSPHPDSYGEAHAPSVVVFGGGAFGT